MYADPSQARTKVAKIYLNENEEALINALHKITGGEKSVILRNILLREAEKELFGDLNFASSNIQNKMPFTGQKNTFSRPKK